MTDPTPRPDAAADVLAADDAATQALLATLARGARTLDDAVTIGRAIVDDDSGDPTWLIAHGCDVIARLLADLARLRAPADLAAIEARAADLATLRAQLRAYLDDRTRSVFDIPVALIQERDEAERASAADVPALLAHIAATRERHAAEVAAARAEALREAGDVARAEMTLWAGSLDCGSEVAIARHRTASDITDAIDALGAKGGGA